MFNKVLDLLFRAEFFIQAHQSLRTAYLQSMPADPIKQTDHFSIPFVNLTILNANLYFFEAVSCIASLLRDVQPDPTKNEISFHDLSNSVPDPTRQGFRDKLSTIFIDYKTSRLKELRDKLVSHKDLDSSGDPTAAFLNLPVQSTVDSSMKIIEALKHLFSETFPGTISNNYFSDFYSAGIDEHVRIFRKISGE
jgi:hypothetical protein